MVFLFCFSGCELIVDDEEFMCRRDAIIHLGLEDVAKGLRLETIGFNVKAKANGSGWNCPVPCSKTDSPFEDAVAGSPCVLPTTADLGRLSLARLASTMEGRGVPQGVVHKEVWSRSVPLCVCCSSWRFV